MATKGQPGFRHAVSVTRQLERAGMIGGESLADTIEASGSAAAQTGRTHDRTPNKPAVTQKILAKQEPSTHDDKVRNESMTLSRISSPKPWRGSELQAKQETWTHHLTAPEIADLRDAAHSALAQGLKRETVMRARFPLHSLQSALKAWREKLMHGNGFVLVRGLPIAEMSNDESAMAYWILGRHLGEAVSQNALGETLVDIRDTGADPTDHTVRLYKTRAEQIFHTDGADIIGLLCLKTAKAGGVSRICSSVHVYNEILGREPALAPFLETNFHNHAHGQFGPSGPKTFEYPIVSRADGVFRMLLLPWYIRNAAADFPDLAGLTPEKARLLDLLEQIPNEPGVALDMNFQPGDMQFLKNAVILHARTAYDDWPEPERKRHLLRLWLSARDFADGDERLREGIPGRKDT